MNKSELLKALEAKLGSRKAASDALEAVVDTIIREVAKGGSVGITGFGTFEKVARAARTGRNPRTGETVRIRKTSVPKFRPGTQFKEYVAAPRTMPKNGMVGIRASAGTKTAAESGSGAGTASTAKKSTAKKTTAKKSTAKKTGSAAPSAKKATAKKAAAKATATKKSATKKATTKKASTKKTAARS